MASDGNCYNGLAQVVTFNLGNAVVLGHGSNPVTPFVGTDISPNSA